MTPTLEFKILPKFVKSPKCPSSSKKGHFHLLPLDFIEWDQIPFGRSKSSLFPISSKLPKYPLYPSNEVLPETQSRKTTLALVCQIVPASALVKDLKTWVQSSNSCPDPIMTKMPFFSQKGRF
jgi:hypothetical protein